MIRGAFYPGRPPLGTPTEISGVVLAMGEEKDYLMRLRRRGVYALMTRGQLEEGESFLLTFALRRVNNRAGSIPVFHAS